MDNYYNALESWLAALISKGTYRPGNKFFDGLPQDLGDKSRRAFGVEYRDEVDRALSDRMKSKSTDDEFDHTLAGVARRLSNDSSVPQESKSLLLREIATLVQFVVAYKSTRIAMERGQHGGRLRIFNPASRGENHDRGR